jgi:predicted nucleic acid-binding protein
MTASALVNARLDPRRADAFRDLVAGRPIIVSFATVTELLFGAVKAQWGDLRVRALERDMSGFIVVQPDDALMQQCAHLRFACEQRGHPLAQKLHEADRWIAATAIAGELDLVSNDKVFANTPGLSVLTTRND